MISWFRTITNRKKEYFRVKILNGTYKIWDLEFRRIQLREMREDMRLEYDKLKEQHDGFQVRKEKLAELPDRKEELDAVTARLEGMEKDLTQLKTQMDALDAEVEGPNGINNLIEANRQLVETIKTYRKTL